MEKLHLLSDEMYVKKILILTLGAEKAQGIHLYLKVIYAPSQQKLNEMKAQYGTHQTRYISKFKHSELYISFSKLEDIIISFQSAESMMRASAIKNIWSVEPQKMLEKFVEDK